MLKLTTKILIKVTVDSSSLFLMVKYIIIIYLKYYTVNVYLKTKPHILDEKENQKECFQIAEKLRNLLIDKYIKIDDDLTFQIYEDSIDIGGDYVAISFDIEMNLIKDTEEDLSYMENVILK